MSLDSRDADSEMKHHCMVIRITGDKQMLFESCEKSYQAKDEAPRADRGKLRGNNQATSTDRKLGGDREIRDRRSHRKRQASDKNSLSVPKEEKEEKEDLDNFLKSKRHDMERGI